MPRGARIPEELETFLEDACVLSDRRALGCLFRTDAVLSTDHTEPPVFGRPAITATISQLWQEGETYVPRPPLILQAGPTALIIAGRTVHVAQRRNREWRYLISRIALARDDER